MPPQMNQRLIPMSTPFSKRHNLNLARFGVLKSATPAQTPPKRPREPEIKGVVRKPSLVFGFFTVVRSAEKTAHAGGGRRKWWC